MSNDKLYRLAIKNTIALARTQQKAQGLHFNEQNQLSLLASILSEYWDGLTPTICERLPKALTPVFDANYRGYVIIQSAHIKVFIPYFFAEIFPQGDLLESILKLVAQVRVFEQGICCISGSACQAGSGLEMGDLDFCEYIPPLEPTSLERLATKIRDPDANAVCYKVRIIQEQDQKLEWKRPLPPDFDGQELSAAAFQQSTWRMLYFIAELSPTSIVEVTKRLLFGALSDSGGETAMSYAFQEAPVLGPPRDLCAPLELGAYLLWLKEQALQLAKDPHPAKTIKAARRLFSATRILKLQPATDELLTLLQRADGARLVALHSRCTLYKKLSSNPDAALRPLVDRLKTTIDQLRGIGGGPYKKLTATEYQALERFRDQAIPALQRISQLLEEEYFGDAP